MLKEQEDKNMTENMMDIGDIEFGAELTLDEMNEISGGAFKKPAAKTGYTIYQIQAHDTLIRNPQVESQDHQSASYPHW